MVRPNIHVIDKYPGYGSDGFAFIRDKMLKMLSEVTLIENSLESSPGKKMTYIFRRISIVGI